MDRSLKPVHSSTFQVSLFMQRILTWSCIKEINGLMTSTIALGLESAMPWNAMFLLEPVFAQTMTSLPVRRLSCTLVCQSLISGRPNCPFTHTANETALSDMGDA